MVSLCMWPSYKDSLPILLEVEDSTIQLFDTLYSNIIHKYTLGRCVFDTTRLNTIEIKMEGCPSVCHTADINGRGCHYASGRDTSTIGGL